MLFSEFIFSSTKWIKSVSIISAMPKFYKNEDILRKDSGFIALENTGLWKI